MFRTKHELTEGEKKCLEAYNREKSAKPRKNLIRLVRHINMFNPVPDENSWEYIFFDRQLTDEQVDFALKMKLRHQYTIKELAELQKMSVEEAAQKAYDPCSSIATLRERRTRCSCRSLRREPWRVR